MAPELPTGVYTPGAPGEKTRVYIHPGGGSLRIYRPAKKGRVIYARGNTGGF